VDERHGHGEARVDVGLLGGDPAEVLQPRQAAVLHHEVEVGEVGGRVVDVGHVEGVQVQRADRRALVHVDVRDAQLPTQFEIPAGHGIGELPAAGVPVPVGGVELDVHHLAPEVLDGGRRPLTRLERLERDEIIRCLTEPSTTVTRAAEELGIGRATLYRRIAQYDISLPPRSADSPA
jgi:hypothetical protein